MPNAPANLRASQIKCERSELPTIARQVQRSLCGRLEGAYCGSRSRCASRWRTTSWGRRVRRNERESTGAAHPDPPTRSRTLSAAPANGATDTYRRARTSLQISRRSPCCHSAGRTAAIVRVSSRSLSGTSASRDRDCNAAFSTALTNRRASVSSRRSGARSTRRSNRCRLDCCAERDAAHRTTTSAAASILRKAVASSRDSIPLTEFRWPNNAPANLRASPTKCERSELPKIARLVQRTL